MQERQRDETAIHHNFLATETRTDQRCFARRLAIEPLHESDEDRQRNDDDDNGDECRHPKPLHIQLRKSVTDLRWKSR